MIIKWSPVEFTLLLPLPNTFLFDVKFITHLFLFIIFVKDVEFSSDPEYVWTICLRTNNQINQNSYIHHVPLTFQKYAPITLWEKGNQILILGSVHVNWAGQLFSLSCSVLVLFYLSLFCGLCLSLDCSFLTAWFLLFKSSCQLM